MSVKPSIHQRVARLHADWDYMYNPGVDHPTATLTTTATAQPASVATAAAVVAEGLVTAKGLRGKEGGVQKGKDQSTAWQAQG